MPCKDARRGLLVAPTLLKSAVMNGPDDVALVPMPPRAPAKTQPGAKRILSGMVADTLALVNKETFKLAEVNFRLGDYEWRKPDYEQILIWAKALRRKPEAVLETLLDEENLLVEADGQRLLFPFWDGPAFSEGRLLLVRWDCVALPLWKFEWVADLHITHLEYKAHYQRDPTSVDLGGLPLRRLQYLSCSDMNLKQLALSDLCALKSLSCDRNLLPALDLSGLAALERLNCSENALAELDLSHTPGLVWLACSFNGISQLDLSAVPSLQILLCSYNSIEKLDLFRTPRLVSLHCADNTLRDLNLAAVGQLSDLDCSNNKLTKLELTHTPQLRELNCAGNNLPSLDLSGLAVSLSCKSKPSRTFQNMLLAKGGTPEANGERHFPLPRHPAGTVRPQKRDSFDLLSVGSTSLQPHGLGFGCRAFDCPRYADPRRHSRRATRHASRSLPLPGRDSSGRGVPAQCDPAAGFGLVLCGIGIPQPPRAKMPQH